jgi:hypothetical protein
VGASLAYARADHVHPIVRVTPPVSSPTVAITGGGTITAQSTAVTSTTEETITYRIRVDTSLTGAAGWRILTVSSLAGYTHMDCHSSAYNSVTAQPVAIMTWVANQVYYQKSADATITFVILVTFGLT